MNIIKLLAKVTAGEELTAEETAFLKAYKEPKADANKIPKDRLDQEITKRKKLDEDLKSITDELDALKNKDLSDAEKLEKEKEDLQKQVDALITERDTAITELGTMKLNSTIATLAKDHKFNDSDYLAYKIKSDGIDVSDADKVKEYMENMKKDEGLQRFFMAPGKPGSGSEDRKPGTGDTAVGQARIDELLKKESLTKREAAEVVNLQTELQAAEK